MKKIKRIVFSIGIISLFGTLTFSCAKEDSLGDSVLIDEPAKKKTDLENWIDETFLDTYNIRVYYKGEKNKTDLERYLTPPKLDRVWPALKVVNQVWLESYREIAGPKFLKDMNAREIVLIGSDNLNNNGTTTLGLADAGYRISLFSLDKINLRSEAAVKQYIHTIQHEYVHILNQTKPFNPNYEKITGNYQQDWHTFDTSEANDMGFISNYALSNANEDFAEQVSWMLRDIEEYRMIVNGVRDKAGQAKILEKEAFVVEYYKTAFDIDLYELCEIALRNTKIAASL